MDKTNLKIGNTSILIDDYIIKLCATPTQPRHYTAFSSEHVTFVMINYIPYKTNLNKCKITKIIQSMFSDDNGNELKITERH